MTDGSGSAGGSGDLFYSLDELMKMECFPDGDCAPFVAMRVRTDAFSAMAAMERAAAAPVPDVLTNGQDDAADWGPASWRVYSDPDTPGAHWMVLWWSAAMDRRGMDINARLRAAVPAGARLLRSGAGAGR